ncbi:MAG: AmmeMemoRadiSam system protein B [Myxococcaceae bacterium]
MRLVCITCLALLSGCATVRPIETTYPGDSEMWADIFAHAEPFHFRARPVAAIAPHHLIDAPELAGFWGALLKKTPSVVVLLGPDHYLVGRAITSPSFGTRWKTTDGDLLAEPLDLEGVDTRDDLFAREHSIHVHTTFLKHFAPNTRFVPLVVRWQTPRAQLEALAQQLHRQLPPDALVVASVDFSHYQPEPWATFHDESSFAAVQSLDLDALPFREVDSPESLIIALRFAQLRGAETATRWLHTNSQRRRTPFVHDSTSHQYFTLAPGPVQPSSSVSVAISGDVPPGSGLDAVERWTWSPTSDAGAPKSPLLAQLRGQEDRFFMGPDLVLFDLPPGTRRTVRALEVVSVDLAKPTPVQTGPCVVVLAHRGALEPAEAERRARALLSSARAVIGRGFGAPREPEWTDDGRLLALSLGAWDGSTRTGQMLGLTCTPAELRAVTVPLAFDEHGTPRLDVDSLRDTLRPRGE